MKMNHTWLGSALLLSTLGLVACDSATATNDKQSTEVKQTVVEAVETVKKTAETASDAVVEKVETVAQGVKEEVKEAVVTKVEQAATVVEDVKEAVAPKVEQAAAVVEDVEEAVAPKVEQVVEDVKEVIAPKTEQVATAVESAAEAPPVQALVNTTPQFKEGTHYFEIFPTMQTDAVGGKVEVVELMWLGCPHCYDLEPTMKEYKKGLPSHVEFKQVPAMLNPRWSADGKLFYIAELLDPKGEKKLVEKVFHAIHVQKRRKMSSPDNMKRFMTQQGISEAAYDSAAKSMALTAKLKRAQQISADSQAQSVPSIIINGKYRTSPYAAGDEKRLLQIVEMLTDREFKKK